MRLEEICDAKTTQAIMSETVENATGLPNACYTSAEWLKAENERLFTQSWMLAGFCHDVPACGDACPVEVAGLPLVIVRGEDDEIRVFHNVCRHRGAVLVTEPCKGKQGLTCPYHGWSYRLDGSLRARPRFYGLDKHDVSPGTNAPTLVPVRHAVWNDFIFVDLSGRQVDFETYWAPFVRRMKGYDFPALRYARTLHFDVAGNWKLIYENFIDAYHVPTLHPKLEAFVPTIGRVAVQTEGSWFYSTCPIGETQEGRGQGLPVFPGLENDHQPTEWFFYLFPGLAMVIWPDQVAVFQLHPRTPDHTHEEIHMYFIGDAATASQFEQRRQDTYESWNELNTEDFLIVENMQKARSSPGFDGGVLSPFWDPPTQHFARLILNAMQ